MSKDITYDLPVKINTSDTGESSNNRKAMNRFIPFKRVDPGIFSIEYQFNSCGIPFTTLCDTGASVNVMPITFARRIGLTNSMKSPPRSIQLANESNIKPIGEL